MDWYEKAQEAADFIVKEFIKAGYKGADSCILIGSGATKIIESFKIKARIAFRTIPNVSHTTFHQGECIWAETEKGKSVLVLNGRLHYYEGYSAQEITFPIRILKLLGITKLLMTNASGGLNPTFEAGELVLIKDHINLMPDHPLRGYNDERFGLRFPDLSNAYDKDLRNLIAECYHRQYSQSIKQGVYVGFQGPSLETPAEYNYLHIIGGDMVGMSTVPEVIVANHCGIRTAVISIVTNICYPPERITETTLEEVIEIAESATPGLSRILVATIDAL